MWGRGGMWVRSNVTSGRNRRWEWRPDAGDTEDGKTTSEGSGRGTRTLDAGLIFADVDIKDAYHNVRIKEGDEWKTTFTTKYGTYEYLVRPFGQTNAPAAFQRWNNRTLQSYIDICCIVYLDDIIIYIFGQSGTTPKGCGRHYPSHQKARNETQTIEMRVSPTRNGVPSIHHQQRRSQS